MTGVLGLRPFVPAKDYPLSARFYEALGFTPVHRNDHVTLLEMEGFTFILQNFFVEQFAANCMVQLLVGNADAWWTRIDAESLVAAFGVKRPLPPVMQPWGMKVGFVFDPSGVLWHVAERPGQDQS